MALVPEFVDGRAFKAVNRVIFGVNPFGTTAQAVAHAFAVKDTGVPQYVHISPSSSASIVIEK